MPPVHGGSTPVQLIDNGLKHSSDGVIEAVLFQPICQPMQSCSWQLTRSYLRPLSETIITFYINFCHHNSKRLNTMIFHNADKTFPSLRELVNHLADNNFIQHTLYQFYSRHLLTNLLLLTCTYCLYFT